MNHGPFSTAVRRLSTAILLAVTALIPLGLGVTTAGAATSTGNGTVTGNVVVRDAPAGFSGEVGLVACPAPVGLAAQTVGLCTTPQYAFSGSGGSYTLTLAAGTWDLREFYSPGYQGGAFLGRVRTVTLQAGQVVRDNLAVRYQPPSIVSGTVTITGVPSSVLIFQRAVIACPTSAPLSGGFPSILCSTDYLSPNSSSYSLPTLSQGSWLLYGGYYTNFGLTTVPIPGVLKVAKGASVTDNLTFAYQTPTNGLLEGTVTITGAPAGFNPLFGVGGCPAVTGSKKHIACPNPQYTLAFSPGGAYSLLLPQGQWHVAGFYELAPFGGQFLSAITPVTITGGAITKVNFTVPYTAPASVHADVTVANVPSGATIAYDVLLACPTIAPYTGGNSFPIECVDALAVSGNPVTISTLPPGKWLLYPGYVNASFSQTIATIPTPVKLTAGASVTKQLTIDYTG